MLRQAARLGTALPFAVTVDGQFAGQVTVGGIQRFPLHSGWIGYWIGSEFAGRGVATLAVAQVVRHAFTHGRLHRVEATVSPANPASQRVLAPPGLPAGGSAAALPRHRRRLAGPPALGADRRGGAGRRRRVAAVLVGDRIRAAVTRVGSPRRR